MIDQLSRRVEEAVVPFRDALDLLDTIPGISQATAEVIIAETGGDMTRFASAKHLASWAGVCPGHHESAGRTKNTKVRPGNPYLKRRRALTPDLGHTRHWILRIRGRTSRGHEELSAGVQGGRGR
ncbi:transposase, partial [Streptomyces sp. NPDC056480]|uniref:transposase n=1 Tax=Streptomyces sp. NPDC056480 TaxID=3345833 RepID=UPI00368DF950